MSLIALGLALALMAHGGETGMTSGQPGILLAGEPVDLSGTSEPALSYGRFRLENRSKSAARLTVEAAWLEFGEHRQPLDRFTLFDTQADRDLDSKALDIAPGAVVSFLVGFARTPFGTSDGKAAVGLKVGTGSGDLEAVSPVTSTRRIPRGS